MSDAMPLGSLPVSTSWFRIRPVTDDVTRIDEPAVDPFLQSNLWHVRGRNRDLIVDAGLGVAQLKKELPCLFANSPILVITHAHLDHVGAAHEFGDRRMHAAELERGPVRASLYTADLSRMLGFEDLPLPEVLIQALPVKGYDPRSFGITPFDVTTYLSGGDVIDLGNRQLIVLHLPGHTPGSICLFDDMSGELFSGDVIYDDLLLDELHESNIDHYVRSMRILRMLPVTRVFPGHGDPFDGDRMRAIIDDYLARRGDR